MIFGGIQKLTLLDYPDRTACTLFTVGCNFKCPYCQNTSLIDFIGDEDKKGSAQKLSESEILGFLKTRQGLLDGVCISGGEPLLQNDLESFIYAVKDLGFLVKLDTNGSCPEKLEKLINSGAIDYVAMDIKNTPEKYALTIGIPGYDTAPVEASISLLYKGTVPCEFRTTVVREYHNGDDLLSIVRWISGAEKYFLQSFVDSEGVAQKGLSGYSDDQMQQFLSSIIKVLPAAELRGV